MLEALHRLQEVERQLAEFRRDHDSRVRRIEQHMRRAKQAEEKLHQNELTVRESQVRLDALQLDVTAREESINKHRLLLNKAKTNKEYAAILTTMNTQKADNAKFETQILQFMEKVQSFTDDAANLQAERTRLLEEAKRAEQAMRDHDAESQAQKDDLQSQRDACAAQLEPTTLDTFNRVAAHHDGEAMVPVLKLRPKRDEYVCSGCNLKVTLEVVNTLQSRDDLQLCKVCGRILYLEAPAKQHSGS